MVVPTSAPLASDPSARLTFVLNPPLSALLLRLPNRVATIRPRRRSGAGAGRPCGLRHRRQRRRCRGSALGCRSRNRQLYLSDGRHGHRGRRHREWRGHSRLVHPEMGHVRIPHDLAADPYPGCCPYHGDCLEGLASGPAIQARWGKPAHDLPAITPAGLWKPATLRSVSPLGYARSPLSD